MEQTTSGNARIQTRRKKKKGRRDVDRPRKQWPLPDPQDWGRRRRNCDLLNKTVVFD